MNVSIRKVFNLSVLIMLVLDLDEQQGFMIVTLPPSFLQFLDLIIFQLTTNSLFQLFPAYLLACLLFLGSL
jgi:hypothetical protein